MRAFQTDSAIPGKLQQVSAWWFNDHKPDMAAQMVEDGEYPADMKYLGQMVENISYYNTLRYFRFDEILKEL